MKEIDFVPDWYRASQRRRSDLAVRITCLCVLAGAMVVWSVRNLAVVRAAETDLAVVRQSYRLQNEPLRQLVTLRSRLSELRDHRALLQTVRGGARASEVLAEVTRLMPEAMVLTSFSLSRERRLPPADAPAGEASPSPAGSAMPCASGSSRRELARIRRTFRCPRCVASPL